MVEFIFKMLLETMCLPSWRLGNFLTGVLEWRTDYHFVDVVYLQEMIELYTDFKAYVQIGGLNMQWAKHENRWLLIIVDTCREEVNIVIIFQINRGSSINVGGLLVTLFALEDHR